jgi:hypothetical protein
MEAGIVSQRGFSREGAKTTKGEHRHVKPFAPSRLRVTCGASTINIDNIEDVFVRLGG